MIIDETLKKFITECEIEVPLFYRHYGKTIRFNFVPYTLEEAHVLSREILTYIFENKDFLYCLYGEIKIPEKTLKRYIKGIPNKIHCIDYRSPWQDGDDMFYNYDNVSFVEVSPNTFNFNKFAGDINYTRDSNEFLISLKEKFAVNYYDYRGMDVFSVDNEDLLESLKTRFEQHPYWYPQGVSEEERIEAFNCFCEQFPYLRRKEKSE